MTDETQPDFFRALQDRVMPELQIVMQGKRRVLEDTGQVALEGTPQEAAKIIGLHVREIYRMCEAGDLRYRCPRGNLANNREKRDALGRKIGYTIVVDLKHAFEIRFGTEQARRAFSDLCLN